MSPAGLQPLLQPSRYYYCPVQADRRLAAPARFTATRLRFWTLCWI